jgi:cation diffusion facilitator family transporter
VEKTHKVESNSRLLFLSVVISTSILLIKFIAFYITRSNAILGDALESIVNVVAGVITLISFSIAHLPKDKNHPYGHGKIEFLSAGFEGGMISIAGFIIIGKSIYNLFVPNELNELSLGIWLTIFSGTANFILGMILLKRGNKTNSAAMQASGRHLLTDVYTTIGLIIGLTLILLTNINWIDQVVAIIFGIIILFSGYKIIR